MVNECNELIKQAKKVEKENPSQAIDLFKQAAQCYSKNNSPKKKNSTLERAGKLLRETAKSKEDPVKALGYYEESASIFSDLGREIDAGKVMQEAQQKFITSARMIRSEGNKLVDLQLAEKKFTTASEYAMLGKDEILSNECWIDSGDKFRNAANNIEDPQKAGEMFTHAILNYKKGKTREKEIGALKEAADKYDRKATELYKTRKDLLLAFDNYIKAATIYTQINSEEKALISATRVDEISETIGIPKDTLVNYIIRQEIDLIPNLQDDYTTAIKTQKKQSPDSSFENFNNYETVKPRGMDRMRQQAIPAPTIRKKSAPPFLEESSVETSLGQAVKERRREELRRGKTEPSMEKIEGTTKTAEIDNLFEEALDESLEDKLPSSEHVVAVENNIETPSSNNAHRIESKTESRISGSSNIDYSQLDKPNVNRNFIEEIKQRTVKEENFVVEERKLDSQIVPGVLSSGKEDYKLPIKGPIIDIFKKQGYVTQDSPTIADLFRIPEYQILSIIIQQHPISLDQIELKTMIGSISMVLSNLQADGLIVQTNDYQWTISQLVKDNLN
ncbi:MAG: hypothetical protein ACW99A_11205 [Candidatus Kariarchaeaceae archaeon]